MQIHYRDEEAIYIQAAHDRVTVIFSTIFKDETDRTFGKVFLQVCITFLLDSYLIILKEFVDARRQNTAMQHAPQVLYSSRDPPLEIRNVPGLKHSDDVGYVTFGKPSTPILPYESSFYFQFFFQGTSLRRTAWNPLSPTFNSSAIISIIILNAQRHTCIVACDTELPNSSKSSIEPKWKIRRLKGRQ